MTYDAKKFWWATWYTEFEDDGSMKFSWAATVYRDINLSGSALVAWWAAAPDQINFVNSNLAAYWFDWWTLTERLYGSMEMQHDYKEWTDIEVHVHWAPSTATAWDVVWQIYYSWQNAWGWAFSTPTLLTASASAAGWVAWNDVYTFIWVISWAGKTINSQLVFQLFRDPTATWDTYTWDAALIQLWVHYECDTTWSRTTTSK